ncbi:MAG TPA: riboflavin biosynthesis protein RibF [Verrucomicrobia bacterium]|nr:riboflavin biosynthesis protein RibF [Verrucomicrobiales bacterium]HIL54899.1 riboflavin biosynthesis protein RibF [Verrucomicrobiota bacterium]
MLILNSFAGLNKIERSVNLAIGFFDGVHEGHEAVIRNVSCGDDSATVVLTFDPHPSSILSPRLPTPIITPLEHKQRLIAKLGVDYLLVIKFDEDRANQSAEKFVSEIVDSCELKLISVGNEFRFGCKRKGDVDFLTELGKDLGFKVIGIDRVRDGRGDVISSTRVRESLKSGNLKDAKSLLGRDFSISGLVTKGDGVGREMSFPTANIEDLESVAIPYGVYAVLADLGGESFQGVANLGVRPTVMGSNNSKPKLEVHLFDFDRMIYGETLEIYFVEYIREEIFFNSLADLKNQINDDVIATKRMFS